jgi:hypothetical protein
METLMNTPSTNILLLDATYDALSAKQIESLETNTGLLKRASLWPRSESLIIVMEDGRRFKLTIQEEPIENA